MPYPDPRRRLPTRLANFGDLATDVADPLRPPTPFLENFSVSILLRDDLRGQNGRLAPAYAG